MRESSTKGRQNGAPLPMTRRQLLAGVGAATILGSLGSFGRARPASAMEVRRARPAPSPIPGGVDMGDPVGLIHFYLPGPEDSATPYHGLPGMGLGFSGFSWNSMIRPRGSVAMTPNALACSKGTGRAETVASDSLSR